MISNKCPLNQQFENSHVYANLGAYAYSEHKISSVKLGFKERLNKEQLGNSEPFPLINMLGSLNE